MWFACDLLPCVIDAVHFERNSKTGKFTAFTEVTSGENTPSCRELICLLSKTAYDADLSLACCDQLAIPPSSGLMKFLAQFNDCGPTFSEWSVHTWAKERSHIWLVALVVTSPLEIFCSGLRMFSVNCSKWAHKNKFSYSDCLRLLKLAPDKGERLVFRLTNGLYVHHHGPKVIFMHVAICEGFARCNKKKEAVSGPKER